MKLIDKSALVAEIERRRDAALMRQRNLETIGDESILNELIADGLNRLIAFINSLEVKEVQEEPVSKDLEEAAWLQYDRNKPPMPPELDLHKELIDFFKAGAEWQKKKDLKEE